jgi:hypothetical protein
MVLRDDASQLSNREKWGYITGMANDEDNLVLRLLREMRQEIADFRVDTQQGFREIRHDFSRLEARVNKVGLDVRELSLQTALLETRMAKVFDFIVEHDKRITALETR